MKYIFVVFCIFIISSFCVKAADLVSAQQPVLADYSEGEKWVWKYKGVTTTGIVRADGKDTKEIIKQNGVLSLLTANGVIPLTNIVEPNKSKTARYVWPLNVGKKWIFEEHWTSEDGTKGSTIQDAEVLSFKEETVEAGTFQAYIIKYTGKITNSRGYSADTEDIYYYSPKLKTFIKLIQKQQDYKYVEELIEYYD